MLLGLLAGMVVLFLASMGLGLVLTGLGLFKPEIPLAHGYSIANFGDRDVEVIILVSGQEQRRYLLRAGRWIHSEDAYSE